MAILEVLLHKLFSATKYKTWSIIGEALPECAVKCIYWDMLLNKDFFNMMFCLDLDQYRLVHTIIVSAM